MNANRSESPLGVLVIGADARLLGWLGELFGRRIKSVPTWMEAIGEASSHKYQLVLGGLAGTAEQSSLAVAALHSADQKVKIILYCEPVLEPLARQALAAGAQDYLIEPLSRAEFAKMLNGQLSALSTDPVQENPASTVDTHNGKPSAQVSKPSHPVAHAAELLGDAEKLVRTIPDVYGLCEELLRAGQSGTGYLLSRAEELLAQKLGLKWVQLQLFEAEPPAQDQTQTQAEHTVDLAKGGKLLIRLGSAKTGKIDPKAQQQLLGQIAQLLGALVDITRQTAILQKLAVTDELTGLYNRRYVYEFTEQVLARAHAERFEITILLFDVDDFKSYNDTYGHATGDEVLRETADLMRRCSREHDLVGRFGGDEFVIIFWDAGERREPNSRHPETAFSLSERFRRTVSEHAYKCLGPAARGTLTISGGLASFPWDASTVDDLFARADDALLRAKGRGKNRIYIVGGQTPE